MKQKVTEAMNVVMSIVFTGITPYVPYLVMAVASPGAGVTGPG